MRICTVLLAIGCTVALLAGCGGGGAGHSALRGPDTPTVQTGEVDFGPFVMRPTAASNMQVQALPSDHGSSFAVFNGVTIDYVAVRELMDRVVFTSTRSGETQLHTCDFFGDNQTQITFNNRVDADPVWSRDGTMMAWTYSTSTMGREILSRPANGGPATHLTMNPANDSHPTWSPDGRWIAFETDREGDWDIYKMLFDGSNQQALTADGPLGPSNFEPDWAPDASKILYMSVDCGMQQIWYMQANGADKSVALINPDWDRYPAWAPWGTRFAYRKDGGPSLGAEIYESDLSTGKEELIVTGAGTDDEPCYSTDGDYIFFTSYRTGSGQIWAKQLDFPHRTHQITNSLGSNWDVDLGSPTVQISRVLVGPPGSDHGYDPVHDSAVAGIVAFNTTGYLNFVRLGIPPASGASLTVTPMDLSDEKFVTTSPVVGVILSAPDMYYIEEDAGIGLPPIMWDFSGATSRSALLYLDVYTGKLVSVVDMGDSVHSAAVAGAAHGVTQEHTRTGVIAHGDFRRVWNSQGELVAEGEIGTVEIDASTDMVRAY